MCSGWASASSAYTFGLRHAFDADHIAAVDNATRKLLADNVAVTDAQLERGEQPNVRKPLSVGFWFSLGHSTIVFGLAFLLSIGVKALAGPVADDDSTLHSVTGVIGASVSGVFLWILGILNFAVLLGIIRIFREMQHGVYNEQQLEEQLNKRGFMNRFLNGLTKSVRKPCAHLPGRRAVRARVRHRNRGRPARARRRRRGVQPAVLLDPRPADPVRSGHVPDGHHRRCVHERRLRVGVRQAGPQGVLQHHDHVDLGRRRTDHRHHRADLGTRPTRPTSPAARSSAIGSINLDYAGYGIVGLFFVSWLIAIGIWHYGSIEEKWSADLAPQSANGTD